LAVPVGPGETFSGISFYLRPQPTVSIGGVVISSDGPVGNQLIRLVPDSGEDFGAGFETAATVTDLDGSFSLTGVLPGSYVIDARSGPSAYALSPTNELRPAAQSRSGSPALWSRTPISVLTADVDNLTVVMSESTTLVGSVTFDGRRPRPTAEEMSEVRVTLHPVAGGRAGTPDGQPDASGSFEIPGVLPDAYHVGVVPPPGWFVDAITGGGEDLTDVPLDTRTGGAVVLAVTFSDHAGELSGTVRTRRGLVVPTATVIVFPSNSETLHPLRARAVRADGSGIFRIGGLPAGEYSVVALEEVDAGGWQEPYLLTRLRTVATSLTLRPGEVRGQDLRLASVR
jgi:hypothetical protein